MTPHSRSCILRYIPYCGPRNILMHHYYANITDWPILFVNYCCQVITCASPSSSIILRRVRHQIGIQPIIQSHLKEKIFVIVQKVIQCEFPVWMCFGTLLFNVTIFMTAKQKNVLFEPYFKTKVSLVSIKYLTIVHHTKASIENGQNS